MATDNHSESYQKYYDRYQRKGCRIDQLHRLTELGVLTTDEFTEITGVKYDEYTDSLTK